MARKPESKEALDAPPPLVGSADTPEAEAGQGTTLSWFGRRQARVSIPRPRILEPVPKHSDVTDEDPGNLLIEGDNRQAMVSLLPQYAGKVDVVLIDPPYNTGKKDFRYSDARFKDPDADTRDGDFVSAEDGGRHAKWLNQMAPTLRIIRDLMAPHGVIFIHINDIELPRLLLLMEEIFDERNKIGLITWKSTVDNNPARVSIDSEYILVWARSLESVASSWRGPVADAKRALLEEAARLRGLGVEIGAARKQWESFLKSNKEALGSYAANYRFLDDEGRAYMMSDVSWPGGGGPTYDVLHPATRKPCRLPSGGWRYQEDTMSELIDEGRIIFGPDETTLPYYKRYLDDDLTGKLPDVLLNFPGRASFSEMTKLFPENPRIFKNPKPVALEDYLLSFVAAKDAIVLDAFAGSGTTGHAVMRLNSRDKGTRRFILIEEGNAGDEYATSLTAERLRRARVKEGIPGGFSFLRVGEAINFDAFEKLQREHLIQSILQTDASGRGGGIKPVKGAKWVIGHNARREAICLHYDAKKHTPITAAILKEIYAEIDKLGLNRPVRVYGESSEIFRSESFTFFKLPDEVANNLTVSLRGGR